MRTKSEPDTTLPAMGKLRVMTEKPKTDREEIAGRLAEARIAAGYRYAVDACRAFGWSYAAYSKYENGQRPLPAEKAIEFALAYAVTLDYLYFGKGKNSNEVGRNKDIVPLQVAALAPIPLMHIEPFEELAAGHPIIPAQDFQAPNGGRRNGKEILVLTFDQAMAAPGNRRSIEAGAKVLIKIGKKPIPSNIVLALVRDEQAAMLRCYHEVERARDGFVVYDLIPFNPAFRTIRIGRPEQAIILGVAETVYQEQRLL
jgi:transcriptional regulator with XRE-family HTH domain